MGRQLGAKVGVRSSAEKEDSSRHATSTMPAAREVAGSRSYRARTLDEQGSSNAARVPDEKVWRTQKRTRRLDAPEV